MTRRSIFTVAANTSGCYLSCTRPCEKKPVEIYMEKDGESMFKQGHECLPAVVDLAAKGSMEKPGICETDMTFKSKRQKTTHDHQPGQKQNQEKLGWPPSRPEDSTTIPK